MPARRANRIRLADVVRELPRGTHDLSRKTIRDSQRWRLLEAITEVVGRYGYADASVAQVIEAAAVSRKTFYEYFADKEACFLTAYEVLSDRLIDALDALGRDHPPGKDRRNAQIAGFLAMLARDRVATRVFMVEVLGAGARALRTRARVNERFGALLLGAGWDPLRRAAIVGGINAVVLEAVLGDRADLSSLEAALSDFVEAAVETP